MPSAQQLIADVGHDYRMTDYKRELETADVRESIDLRHLPLRFWVGLGILGITLAIGILMRPLGNLALRVFCACGTVGLGFVIAGLGMGLVRSRQGRAINERGSRDM